VVAKDNAMRRLERILSDEDYGPKLARLNRKDESHVLDLIDRNQGRKARAEILRLDEERRAKRRTRPTAQSTTTTPTVDIETLRAQAFARMRQQVRGKYSTQKKGVNNMNQPILEFTVNASGDQIKERASMNPTEFWRTYGPEDIAPDLDYEFNPFWYN